MGRREEKKGELIEKGIIRPLNVLPGASQFLEVSLKPGGWEKGSYDIWSWDLTFDRFYKRQ